MKFHRLLLPLLSLASITAWTNQKVEVICTDLSSFGESYLVTEPHNIDVKEFTKASCLPIKVEITNNSDKEIVVDPLLNQHLLTTQQIANLIQIDLGLTKHIIVSVFSAATTIGTLAISIPPIYYSYHHRRKYILAYFLTASLLALDAYYGNQIIKKYCSFITNSFYKNIKALNLLDAKPIMPGETVTRIAFIRPSDTQSMTLYFKKQPNEIVYLDCPFREMS